MRTLQVEEMRRVSGGDMIETRLDSDWFEGCSLEGIGGDISFDCSWDVGSGDFSLGWDFADAGFAEFESEPFTVTFEYDTATENWSFSADIHEGNWNMGLSVDNEGNPAFSASVAF